MKKAKKILIFVALAMILTGVFCIAFVGFRLKGNWKELTPAGTYIKRVYDVEQDYSVIDIRSIKQNLNVVKSDDERTHYVSFEKDELTYNVKVENDTLIIEPVYSADLLDLDLSFAPAPNELQLPKKEYEKFQAKTGDSNLIVADPFVFRETNILCASGNVYLYDTQSEEVIVNNTSGNVTAERVKFGQTDIDVGSGIVTLNSTEITGDLIVSVMSGNIFGEGNHWKNASLGSVSGNVCLGSEEFDENTGGDLTLGSESGNIELTRIIVGGNLIVRAKSGGIRLERSDAVNMELSAGSGNIKGTLLTPKMYEATAGFGNVNVPPDDRTGGICIAKTESGNINLSYAE